MRFRFGPFVLDTDARELLRDGTPVHLSPKAYLLLEALLEKDSPTEVLRGILRILFTGQP